MRPMVGIRRSLLYSIYIKPRRHQSRQILVMKYDISSFNALSCAQVGDKSALLSGTTHAEDNEHVNGWRLACQSCYIIAATFWLATNTTAECVKACFHVAHTRRLQISAKCRMNSAT